MTDGNGKLRDAMESTAALTMGRFVMPILVSLVGVAGTVILWLVWHSVEEVKANHINAASEMWKTIGKINDIQHQDEVIVQRQLDISDSLKALTQDHEQRIRTLERPANH